MAITRAQQVRQMLKAGGGMLVSPSKDGKRPGYRFGDERDTRGFRERVDREVRENRRNEDRANLREQASVAATLGKTTPTMREVREIVNRGEDDRGNVLQNRNQRNIVEYNENLKKIEDNKDLSTLQKFNAKKKLRNQRYINQKYSQLAAGMAQKYGLSQKQLQDLLEAYDRDEDQVEFFGKMQDILDMDPSARNLGQDFNEGIMKGALGAIELSPRMKKGIPLSTAELFDMTDPTSRIELPGVLGLAQGDESFSNVLSGLNRLKTLDEISQTRGGVTQKDLDNYVSLTSGKGGIDPLTGKEVDALFYEQPGNDRSPQETDPCLGPNPPAYCFANQDPTPDPVTPTRNLGGLAPRFAGSIFDFTGMADGGRIGAAEGGIMDLETGRQMYFLGKLVKKATRAVKKIAKSPLGKVAMGAAALKFGPAIFGKGSFNPFLAESVGGDTMFSGLGKFLAKRGLVDKAGALTLGGKLGLGALTLPFLSDEEEEQDMNMGPELTMEELRAIRNSPYRYMAPAFTGSKYEFADGGRIGLKNGNGVADEEAENAKFIKRVRELMDEGFDMGEAVKEAMKEGYANGGRIGLKGGTGSKILNFLKPFGGDTKGSKQLEGLLYGSEGIGEILRLLSSSGMFAEGGDVEPVAKKTMPLLDMGGKEMDLRAEGGFVPIGRMEKADDVPARLSKNEFVFTADAVRNAGDGDVDKGAEVMYNMMKNLESGGDVSEESQGLEGARDMFQTSKRLEEVL